MCGIVAIIRKRDRNVEEPELRKMLSVLRHRGPDGEGAIVLGGCGLGMVRLSIIDLRSPGLSPYVVRRGTDGDPRAAIVFNGEIFNFIELRRELEEHGVQFETTSDTEVLLKSYLHWGQGCLDRLNGMFAFVIADFERNRLFAARDIAGEKPLYYAETDEEFVIASEMKAILARTGLRGIHITDEFRAFEYMTGRETLFEGIHSFLPAEQLVVEGLDGDVRGIHFGEYWNVESQQVDVDPDHAVDRLDELLTDAVALRLRADVPIGLYLSGGIDSALLAYLARPEIAFSIHFPEGPKFDELHYAEMVASDIGCEHVIVRPGLSDFEQHIDDVLYHLDMPVGSLSVLPLYMLAREAATRVKIVLSGEGADELFSGYTRYLLPYRDECAHKVAELQHYHSLIDYYYGASVDRFAHLLNRGTVVDDVVKSVISPHFNRFADIRHAMGYTEFKLMLVALLHMEDRMASAFGLENRAPFLDKRLIAFAFSIPGDLKIREETTKFLVREVAKRYIPKAIIERKEKLGLIAPINRWMKFDGPRGEFDRGMYNALCYERWKRVFFEERRFETAAHANRPL